MHVQYISDSKGVTTGVFIPIEEWNKLKTKFKGIEAEEKEVPDWQKNEVRERIAEYKQNPDNAEDFDEAMNDIERDF
ncbi:MAG: addiction module component CHP02574 family protein [Chitinophagaceae bacterium]|nr:MAG: addiction module component CHP02574 family protein [Chitinophagaceae bacterium]